MRCSENFEKVLSLPVTLSCLSEKLLGRVAAQFSIDQLEILQDPKNKVVNKLFRKKLEELLRSTVVNKCKICGMLYTQPQESKLVCPKAAPTVSHMIF